MGRSGSLTLHRPRVKPSPILREMNLTKDHFHLFFVLFESFITFLSVYECVNKVCSRAVVA